MERIRRYSGKREAILECLRQSRSHPTAEAIYQQLKPTMPDLSLATVYRNLAMFKQEGHIASLGVVNGMERFDYNTKPHIHLVCFSCGSVLDMPEVDIPQELILEASEKTGSEIRDCSITFTGRCPDCCKKTLQ